MFTLGIEIRGNNWLRCEEVVNTNNHAGDDVHGSAAREEAQIIGERRYTYRSIEYYNAGTCFRV